MDRDRYMYERGRDLGGRPGGGFLPTPIDDYEMGRDSRERGPYGASGILGEGPRGRSLLSEPAAPPSLMARNGPAPVADPLTAGLQEQLLNHKRLEEKLSLRESQLALASNLLQQQSQMIGDINVKMGAPGLMGPAPGPLGPAPGPSPGRIPSLLDGPPGPRPGPPIMPMKRPSEGMRMDMKRSRFDQGPPPTVHLGRPEFDRPGGARRDDYDPEFPTTDRLSGPKSRFFCHACSEECFNESAFGQHMRSRQHEDRMRGVSEAARSNMARSQAQQHLRLLEDDDTFCKLCVEPLKIPADKHKRTSIHRKRVVQVNMGCGWCNVPGFKNFKEVLNHRATKRHMDNDKKKKDSESSRRPESRDRDRRDRDRRRHDDGHSRDKDKKSSSSSSSSSTKKDSKDSKSNGTSKSSTSSKPTEKKVEAKPKPVVKDEKALQAQLEATEKDMKEMETATFDSKKAVGQTLVIPVTGFFCKLCHKFYNNEEAAKVGHCKTQVHFDKFKAAMLVKLKKKVEADKKALDVAIQEKAEKEAKDKIEIKNDEETKVKEEEKSVEGGEKKVEEKRADDIVKTEEQNQGDKTMVMDDTVDIAKVINEEKSLTDSENGAEDSQNQNGDTELIEEDQDMADNSDTAIIGLDESIEEQADDTQNEVENEMEAETDNTEIETEEGTEETEPTPTEALEGATPTKSPRGRVRTGKPRGGKAKRGKK